MVTMPNRHACLDAEYLSREQRLVRSIDDLIDRFENCHLEVILDDAPAKGLLNPVVADQARLFFAIENYAALVGANRDCHTERSYASRCRWLKLYYNHAAGYAEVLKPLLRGEMPALVDDCLLRAKASLTHTGVLPSDGP